VNVRFTTWLSEKEMEEIEKAAQRLNSSRNLIVRMAVRQFLGLDSKGQMERVLHVTSDTSATERKAG
jgi:metal-responsive CopG/Arc/MetJ family transcriptional regulator